MPRKASRSGEAQRRRQARYRRRLAIERRPEASAVDIAVAAAVAGYVGDAARDPSLDTRMLRRILQDAMHRLLSFGHDREAARAVVIRRMGRFGHVVPPGLDGSLPES